MCAGASFGGSRSSRRFSTRSSQRYGEHGLLTFDREPLTRSPTVEVAHEALLGQWERLRSWVDERREDLLLHRRLAEAVQEWEESGRAEDYLPREGRLAQFESWAAATDIGITEGEREYLAAGRRRADERRRRTGRRRRAVLVALAVAAAVSAVLAAAALVSRERAKDQEALATSRELAASSIAVLDRDPELSVLLALEAAEAAEPTYEAVSALHEGLREHRTLWPLQREPEEGAVSADIAILVVPEPGRAIGARGAAEPARSLGCRRQRATVGRRVRGGRARPRALLHGRSAGRRSRRLGRRGPCSAGGSAGDHLLGCRDGARGALRARRPVPGARVQSERPVRRSRSTRRGNCAGVEHSPG